MLLLCVIVILIIGLVNIELFLTVWNLDLSENKCFAKVLESLTLYFTFAKKSDIL